MTPGRSAVTDDPCASSRPLRRFRIRSVRVRATAGASLVVLVALIAAAIALTATLRNSQIGSIDDTLALRAVDIESLVDGGATPASVAVESDEDGFVQLIDASGRVVAASANVSGEEMITDRPAGDTATESIAVLDGESFRVLVHATDGARRYTIVVGTTLEGLERNQSVLVVSLAIGIPILLAVIGALVWAVVGRALRPVESIRNQVAAIGQHDLDRRVPVPDADDEIGRLAITMNQMLDRLEDAQRRQARFVSDASHELRTPIAVIRHELEVAIRSDGDEHWREVANDVLEEDLRMQRLVDDLLAVARVDGRAGPLQRSLVDLDDLVLGESHRGPLPVPVDVAGVSAGQVRGDEEQLRRVVRNLLENAARHATSRIAVHVASDHGVVVLDVDDDGPGVAEADRERIFERFARADDARSRETGGAGLGLAIVRDIVTGHGGTVRAVRSPWLGGARFTVTLPDARS